MVRAERFESEAGEPASAQRVPAGADDGHGSIGGQAVQRYAVPPVIIGKELEKDEPMPM